MVRPCWSVLLTLVCACHQSPAPSHGDAGRRSPAARSPSPGIEPDLSGACFFARTQDVSRALVLDKLTVDVTPGPQATRSHLAITVGNPGEGQVEAVLRLPIPPGAAVTRAVLHVAGRPVEGMFVERARAREIYRSITERRRDPALVTWGGPDVVEATIFPVEKKEPRTLELEWVEPTASRDGQAWYRVPVVANGRQKVWMPTQVTVNGRPVPLAERTWLPLTEMVAPGAAATARASGDAFAYAMLPAKQAPRMAPHLVLVAETSATMSADDRKRQRALIVALLKGLPEDTGVTLMSADWGVSTVLGDAVPSVVQIALDRLDGIVSAGALDLERDLLAASQRARAVDARVIAWVGRGLDWFRGDGLAAPLRQMREAGQTLLVLGRGAQPILDVAALTGGDDLPWASVNKAVARMLDLFGRTSPEVSLRGVEQLYPLATVTGETRWLARFVGESPAGLARSDAADLEALWARANVGAALEKGSRRGEAHGVLTPLSSLLVLEHASDCARWGLPTSGSTDEPGVRASDPAATPSQTGRRAQPSDMRFGTFRRGPECVGHAYGMRGAGLGGAGPGNEGNLGLGSFSTLGKGGGGGTGTTYRRVIQSPATITVEIPSVRGTLDKEVLRRIVRLHLNELHYCRDLQPGLRSLAGRLGVRFEIDRQGEVSEPRIVSATASMSSIELCVDQVIRRWVFPKPPGGGSVTVTLSLTFSAQRFTTDPTLPFLTNLQREPRLPEPSEWDLGLAILRRKRELKERVAQVSAVLGGPNTESPVVLAWWIVEHSPSPVALATSSCLLAASLLREAGLDSDAVRVLSEAGADAPTVIGNQYRRWHHASDLARLRALATRK
jgi:hypothetical protein